MLIYRPFGCLARGNHQNFKRLDLKFTRTRWSNQRGSSSGGLQQRVKVKWTPQETTPAPTNDGKLLVPALFTFGFSGSCYVLSSIWEYENLRSRALNFKQQATGWIQKQFSPPKHGDFRNHLNHWWKNLTAEQKLYYAILLANATVFLAWRMPSLQHFMVTNFTSNPFASAVCWPMVFSTFSHYSAIHFGLNMYVLHSFMNATAHTMGKEQFLGFYLSAGVFSSFASHVYKTILRTPGVSLGASGAIMGVLAYFCSQHPDALLQVAFVPGFTFSASSGLKALMCVDALGMAMRWKLFDHAAHLGGALFGIFWYHWGQKHIWGERVGMVQQWHDFRTKTDV